MSRRAAIILTAVLAVFIIAMVIGVVFMVRGARTSQVHLIQDGYKGWVSVVYGVQGAPPLPVEEGHQLLRYGADGKLQTSTGFEEGWSVDAHYYVKGDQRTPLRQVPPGFEGEIWGAHTSSHRVTVVRGEVTREGASSGFFVGTEEEFRAAQKSWMLGIDP